MITLIIFFCSQFQLRTIEKNNCKIKNDNWQNLQCWLRPHLNVCLSCRVTWCIKYNIAQTVNCLLCFVVACSSVADKLKGGKQVSAELYHSVSVYFSDIVHFTEICSGSSPIEVVNMLNDLYTVFDSTIAKYDVYKVKPPTFGNLIRCLQDCHPLPSQGVTDNN